MPSSQLQSPRSLVTQLFDALSARANGSSEQGAAEEEARAGNRQKDMGGDVKKQMLALHVAFPNEMMPALDLLDRSLVTRFRICRDIAHPEGAAPQEPHGNLEGTHMHVAPGSNIHDASFVDAPTHVPPPPDALGPTHPSDTDMLDASPPHPALPDNASHTPPQDAPIASKDTVYYVRSAQQRASRFSASFDTLTAYEVRLDAWNCSCPAFAFSAFPPVHPEPEVQMYDADGGGAEKEAAWRFGGAALGDGMPPVCKHLLACVLAERCAGLFGGGVQERQVGVEEAAGWAAGWGD